MFLQEGVTTHDENMQYLNLAVRAFAKVQTQRRRDRRPAKRDSSGQTLENISSFTVPFGPHLTPVLCPRELAQGRRSPERGGAGTAHQKGRECLTQASSRYCGDGALGISAGDHREPGTTSITTNDLLDCLVHPDVMARVTELLLDRHAGNHETDT